MSSRGYLRTRKAKSRGTAPAALQAQPTPERLAQLTRIAGRLELGHSGHGHVVMTVRDSPLEAMRSRGDLSDSQYGAATKYRHHWYHAGLAGSLASPDMNAAHATTDPAFGPRTEAQVHHLRQVRSANTVVGSLGVAVLDHVVCREETLKAFGTAIGWHSAPRGIEATRKLLTRTLDSLAHHWGLQ